MKPVLALSLLLVLMPAIGSAQERYNPKRSGHPLRVAAYLASPPFVLLDALIFRPAWHIGGVEPIRWLVGREKPREDIEVPPPSAPPKP